MEKYMLEALEEAKKALDVFNEVPVGCVFVYKDEIIARGHNLVNLTKNPTRHAEFVCIDEVLNYCKANELDFNDVFKEIIVVVSVEPCVMCMGALYDLGIKEIYYGCKNDRFGGSTVVDVASLVKTDTKLVGGINDKEAMDLLKQFYATGNPLAPVSAKPVNGQK
ncbi:tRNA-specific adenosine deaminase 2 [Chironomus tepperi]|uniref:tRNA-specific adenosine deaminase 2 n=1 Tax=Chironomus tepperi TaxID=113505 RepID=UPI00391FC064